MYTHIKLPEALISPTYVCILHILQEKLAAAHLYVIRQSIYPVDKSGAKQDELNILPVTFISFLATLVEVEVAACCLLHLLP